MSASFEQDKLNEKYQFLQIDFAMAYSCKYQNEIQSALWSQRSVNLFTAAVYNTNGHETSFLIVTDSVLFFVQDLISNIKVDEGQELVIYS